MFGKDKRVFEPKWYIIICTAALGSFAKSIRDRSFLCGVGGELTPHKNDLYRVDLAKLRRAAVQMIMYAFWGGSYVFREKNLFLLPNTSPS